MTKALAALHHATYGGVYYAANINFADLTTQPTWAKLGVTGLANLLVKRMQNDFYTPYDDIYVQLDNDTVYKYNGASWDEIMTLADARTATGLASGVMGYVTVDRTIAGVVYIPMMQTVTAVKLLKSVDYGANWSVITVTGFTPAFLSATYAYVQAVGNNIAVCIGAVYRGVTFSNNGGTLWTWNQAWPSSGGGAPVKIDRHNPGDVYYRQSATDADLIKITVSGETELQSGYGLVWNGTAHEQNHWIDPSTAGHHRIIRYLSTKVAIFSTIDTWANFVDSTPTDLLTIGLQPGAIAAALENADYGMFGITDSSIGAAANHRVYGFVGDNPTTSPGIGGTNHQTPPYTDAIPGATDAYIADQGIFVGEAPATTGIEIYSVEHDAYDTDHTPKRGDRSSWRDMDADTNDAGDPASYSHAEDIQEGTPQRHNPWPATSGQAPVSDGTKYVATDITTQAELNTHAGLVIPNVHTGTWDAHKVLIGPTSGAAATPTIRLLALADLPGDLHEHLINIDFSALCDGSETVFTTPAVFRAGSSALYLNGLRQRLDTHYTEAATYDSITMDTAPASGDELIMDVIISLSDYLSIGRLLLESGDYLLLETGDKLVLE